MRRTSLRALALVIMTLHLTSLTGPALATRKSAARHVQTPETRGAPQDPVRSGVPAGYSHSQLHLKFREGTAIRLERREFVSDAGVPFSGLRQVLTGFPQARIERLFSLQPEALAAQTARIEAESERELADLSLYYRIVVSSDDDIWALIEALNALPIVEFAYPQPRPAPPPVTPDFVGLQGYRGPAPDGIDADFAADVPGAMGEHVKVVDIEYSWNLAHEDVSKAGAPSALIPNGTSVDPFSNTDHGTAVLGELVADDNGFGVTGLIPSAGLGMVNAANEEDGYDLQDSIVVAHQNLDAGDVMLIEQQISGAFGGCVTEQVGCVPVEWVPAYYDAIVAATADGIIVVEAAGNGNQDLDDPAYGTPFPSGRPDSGAIIVGAGGSPDCADLAQPARSRIAFSTYGSRVDLQGWGECVTTAGYGDLQGGPKTNDAYTAHFSGTSSASPIVAAAAASLSSVLEEANGIPPTPQEVRTRLIDTGTPQDFTSPGALQGEIGPLPDLAAALGAVSSPSADLSITKSDRPDPITVRRRLTYRLRIDNRGPDAATGVTTTDTLPAGVRFVSATAQLGFCSRASRTVTCALRTLHPGERRIVTIVVRPRAVGRVSNAAQVTADQDDPNPANNFDRERTRVRRPR